MEVQRITSQVNLKTEVKVSPEKVRAIRSQLHPLVLPYHDKNGNKIHIWQLGDEKLIGAVLGSRTYFQERSC